MFFFKRKEIVLDCFTTRPDVYTYFPIQPASKLIPDWWKKLPSNYTTNGLDQNPTLKGCVGFIDYHSTAITIPLWTDLSFKTTESNQHVEWLCADRTTLIQAHDIAQFGLYLKGNKFIHLKIVSPWLFNCKEDIKFVFSGNNWSLLTPQDLIIPNGVTNFKYQNSVNINMLLFFRGNQILKLNANSPLIHIFPMTEKNIKLKTHLVGEEEYSKISQLYATNFFYKNYFRHKNLAKSTKRCPMSSILKS